MKLKYILLATLSILSIETFAQKLFVAPEIGFSQQLIENDKNFGKSYKNSLTIGGRAEYRLTDNIAFQIGVLNTSKFKNYSAYDSASIIERYGPLFELAGVETATIKNLADTIGLNLNAYETTKGQIKMKYLEIPITASYKLKVSPDNYLNFTGGYYVAFLSSVLRKEEINTNVPLLKAIDLSRLDTNNVSGIFLPPSDITIVSESTKKDNLVTLDHGWVMGVGYTAKNLSFNLNYTVSASDYRIARTIEKYDNHKVVRFTISYNFGIKLPKKAAEVTAK